MSATSRRPGPLRDLPLDPFLAAPAPSRSPFKPGVKRPRADPEPSVANQRVFLPSLDAEASTSAGQPEKKRRLTPPPSRKLDFGPSRDIRDAFSPLGLSLGSVKISDIAPMSPATPSTTTTKVLRLAPSPELDAPASIAKFTGTGDEIDAFFSTPTRPPHVDNLVQTPLAQLMGFANPDPSKMPVYATDLSPSSRAMPPPAPLLIPRALPPSPNRASVHYPGFDIYRDAHVVLPILRSTTAATASISTPPSTANSSGEDEDDEEVDENEPCQQEEDKENLIPLRPLYKHKAATVPASNATNAGLLLLSPAAKTRTSAPASPLRGTSATPRGLTSSARMLFNPGKTSGKRPTNDNLKALRRLMEEEADQDASI